MSKIVLNQHAIELSNQDKIYFPKEKITKGDLIEYYRKNAKNILKYCKDRPMVLLRYPNGITKPPFYQKNASKYFPSWIKTIKVESHTLEGSNNYVVCNNAATLIYLVNQACITPHLWLSKINKLNYPDALIFDLDPTTSNMSEFKMICKIALKLKEVLEACRLKPFVMTTGSRGLHVRVPLKPDSTFDKVRDFARKVAKKIIEENPKKITLESRKEKRKNKILIDVMRNGFGALAVMPYAVRAKSGAPIATPINWSELKSSTFNPQKYNIKNIFTYLSKKGDPWKTMQKCAKSIKKLKI